MHCQSVPHGGQKGPFVVATPLMVPWLTRRLDRIGSPTLDWVQVEVSTRCNAACIYCPHTLMKDRWVSRDMPLELFSKLTPFLRRTDLVYLQGWGEPLLNDHLFEMIQICKDRSKRVGFTTNGMSLTENTIQTLIDLQVDVIGISLAGTTVSTHNRIRKGTDLKKIMSSLARLRKIKTERKTEAPAIHLAYLMMKSNFHELKETVLLAKEVGARQLVANNLTLILDPKLSAEAVFHDGKHMHEYRNALEAIGQEAARENIVFDYHGPDLDDASPCCRENVYQACVINVEGEVVPCVFTNPVVSCHYIFKDQLLPMKALSFGSIQNESLTHIWKKKEYREFRHLFDPNVGIKPGQTRLEMPECCRNCYNRLGTHFHLHQTPNLSALFSDTVQPFSWKS